MGGIRKDVVDFVACCLCFRPGGFFQRLPIFEWKWEQISMHFVTGLPRTSHGSDSVWVIVDQLTKSAYFILIKVSFSVERLAHIYIQGLCDFMVCQFLIISDRGSVFTSHF